MYVTTVRGRRYENILIRKFFDTKISRITVHTNTVSVIKVGYKITHLNQILILYKHR